MSQQQWATLLLQNVGAPVTQNNIDNIMRWMTAEEPTSNWFDRNNPLNASVGTGTVDGTGSYATLEIGAQYTAGMIRQGNMAGIYQALMNDAQPSAFSAAVVASPWASSHYGGDPNHIANIPVPNGTVTGGLSEPGSAPPNATGGGTINAASPTTPSGQTLSMSDIPAVQQYIRSNFGTDAWLLDIPDVATVLEQAVVNGDSAEQVQAAIQQTNWWKTTSQAVKNYEQDKANNPADYSFTTPGSKAAQTVAQIQSMAGQIGVSLAPETAQELAQNALQFGWSSQQIQQAIGSHANTSGQGPGNAGGIADQIKAMASSYYMTLTPQALQSWAQNIAAGTQTLQQFQAQMQQNAALKWTGFAGQLQAGNNMVQLTDSLRQEAAKTMEVDPNSIDFMNNPTYSKILDYVPPDTANGVHRVMTLSEMDQYLKSQPAWGYTQAARDSAAQLEQTLATTWGRIAS